MKARTLISFIFFTLAFFCSANIGISHSCYSCSNRDDNGFCDTQDINNHKCIEGGLPTCYIGDCNGSPQQ